jgi:hypothetical protein
MYREEPHNPGDSGWRFFSGSEGGAYLDDPDHSGVYDVNTIANYDPDVVAVLDEPIGSAFERDARGVLVAAVDPAENELFPAEARAEPLNPRYPAVVRTQLVGDGWSLHLPRYFNRREEDRLVFWRPGITVWVYAGRVVHGGALPNGELERMQLIVPADARELEALPGDRIARLGYRTADPYRGDGGERTVHVFHGYVSRGEGYVDLEAYADNAADLAVAREIWLSIDHALPA